jgi:hypothetical protein
MTRPATKLMTPKALLGQPSAFIPPLMSLAALSVVIWHLAASGVAREADEGAAAHLFQLLMAGQVPVAVVFAVRWLRRAPQPAVWVLGLQIAAALLALAPVIFLGL